MKTITGVDTTENEIQTYKNQRSQECELKTSKTTNKAIPHENNNDTRSWAHTNTEYDKYNDAYDKNLSLHDEMA